jgi:hypothetical protein
MTISSRRLRAAFLLAACAVNLAVAFGAGTLAVAQNRSVEVPAARQLGASEWLAAPGASGVDYSANGPSLAGLSLLQTIPAAAAARAGYLIQAQCSAGLTVVFDDPAGAVAPTVVVLQGAAAAGGQGGSLSMAGMPHTGRIRIYSSAAGCQMAARSW